VGVPVMISGAKWTARASECPDCLHAVIKGGWDGVGGTVATCAASLQGATAAGAHREPRTAPSRTAPWAGCGAKHTRAHACSDTRTHTHGRAHARQQPRSARSTACVLRRASPVGVFAAVLAVREVRHLQGTASTLQLAGGTRPFPLRSRALHLQAWAAAKHVRADPASPAAPKPRASDCPGVAH
jgi:hypothetical protein